MNEQKETNLRRLTRTSFVAVLCISTLAILALKSRPLSDVQARRTQIANSQNNATRSVRVKVRQLPADGGRVLVTLSCDDAKLRGTGEILQLSCTLQNNSPVAMVAGTVNVLTTIQLNGKDDVVSSYETFDTALHPDFRAEKQDNLIQPGMVYRLDVGSADFGESSVQDFFVEIDYIEFLDGSSTGRDRVGSRTIGDIRKGAAKYKEWLVKQYNAKPKSLKTIGDLLDNENIPTTEIGLDNADQNSGASLYRKNARRMHKLNGSDEYLKRLVTR